MTIDILNLEWPTSDRDLNITIPSLVYLSKKYGIRYKVGSIFNGYYYLLKYKPKVLLISNFQGANINSDIVSVASSAGIYVVSLISEGNPPAWDAKQFLWGNIKNQQELPVQKMLLWSERSRDIFINKYPELEQRLITVGGTGFDRYKLLQFMKKSEFLERNGLTKYQKVVGIAAWGFDLLWGEYFEKHENYYIEEIGKEQVYMHRNDLTKINRIYKMLIEKNKDTLFILRYHPGNFNLRKSEFYGLDHFDNVFISNKDINDNYKIADLINVSDLWIGYETTTALEAWLLDKTTFLVNPTRSDFKRDLTHKGSPIVKTYQEAQCFIDEFFDSKKIDDFIKFEKERKQIIKNIIEYSDGKNHIRAAEEILELVNRENQPISFNFGIFKKIFKQILKLLLSRSVYKKRWPELDYQSDFYKPYERLYKNAIDNEVDITATKILNQKG